jgi:Domain of unknown function (DUF397)
MHELDLTHAHWRKSSYSSGNGQCVEVAHVRAQWHKSSRSSGDGACVEVAPLPEVVAIRDSKDPAGPKLIFTPADWRAFISAVTEGR